MFFHDACLFFSFFRTCRSEGKASSGVPGGVFLTHVNSLSKRRRGGGC